MKFNFQKYKEWRIRKEKIDEEVIDILETFNSMEKYDGLEYEELWKMNKIILKDWCDE